MISHLESLLEDACPDLRVCSCGGCHHVLVSNAECERVPHFSRGIAPLYIRASGVPFCRGCSTERKMLAVLAGRKRVASRGRAK